MELEVTRFLNLNELSTAAADLVLKLAEESVRERDAFNWSISGGGTPKKLFELLAAQPYKERMPWDKVHLFWVDERCVPDDHPDSNFNMAAASMISKVPLITQNVRAILAGLTPHDDVAKGYEGLMRADFGMEEAQGGFPEFDLILLGIGPDGHTASLFPDSAALEEKTRWVVAVPAPPLSPAVPRITMTLPAINNAGNVAFLVSGDGKKEVVDAILDDREKAAENYPAARVNPSGALHWFIDSEST